MTIPNSKLTAFVERVERIKEDIKIGQQDLKEVFAEAKADGYDLKVLKRLIKARPQGGFCRGKSGRLRSKGSQAAY